MAVNVELRKKISGDFDNEDSIIYPKANWNNIDNKPATFAPALSAIGVSELVGGSVTTLRGVNASNLKAGIEGIIAAYDFSNIIDADALTEEEGDARYQKVSDGFIDNGAPTKAALGIFPSNAKTMIGNEFNVLLNGSLNDRLTYTVSGSSGFTVSQLKSLTDGKMSPQYSPDGVNPLDPAIITISGLPTAHTQTGGVIGWTSRYWNPTKYKIEVYEDYYAHDWVTIVDHSVNAATTQNIAIPLYPNGFHGVIEQIRITIYESNGSAGANGYPRWGLSEIFFHHPEAIGVYQYANAGFVGGYAESELMKRVSNRWVGVEDSSGDDCYLQWSDNNETLFDQSFFATLTDYGDKTAQRTLWKIGGLTSQFGIETGQYFKQSNILLGTGIRSGNRAELHLHAVGDYVSEIMFGKDARTDNNVRWTLSDRAGSQGEGSFVIYAGPQQTGSGFSQRMVMTNTDVDFAGELKEAGKRVYAVDNPPSMMSVYRDTITDFDTAFTPGYYVFSSNAVNGPATSIYGTCHIVTSNNITYNETNNWIWQYVHTTHGDYYYRYRVNTGSWTTWYRIYTSQDKPSFDDLGATTVGQALLNLANPSSYGYLQVTSGGATYLLTAAQLTQVLDEVTTTTDGVMTHEDKVALDTLKAMLIDSDPAMIDNIQEVLDTFANFAEGADINAILAGKASKTADQYLTGRQWLGATQITSGSSAKLQVNGLSRMGSIYLHDVETGNDPLENVGKKLANAYGNLQYDGKRVLLFETDVAEAATVSKIPIRNANGDIFARLFRSEYTANNDSPNYIMTQKAVGVGADNYIRPTSLATLKSSMSLNNVTNESKATMFDDPSFTGIATFADRINMQENHFINRRFEMDNDNSSVTYLILCENTTYNDVNGRITMDRTSGLRHAVQLDIIVSAGNAAAPVGTIVSHGVAGNGTPSYRLVRLTYNSVEYIAVEFTNPDSFHESSGAYFTGRIVNSGSNTFLQVAAASVSNIVAFGANYSHQINGKDIIVDNDSRLTDSRPASDVYTWAKAATKPTYTAAEIGALASGGTAVNSDKVDNKHISVLTESAYAALGTKDANTIYITTAG